MKVYADTNILLDWLFQGREGSEFSVTVFATARSKQFDLVISTQSILDAVYISHKLGMPFEIFLKALREIRQFVQIVGIDDIDLLWAMEHYTGDFEDDAQYASAYNAVCDYMITHDKKLLEHNDPMCPMLVISPQEFVAAMTA